MTKYPLHMAVIFYFLGIFSSLFIYTRVEIVKNQNTPLQIEKCRIQANDPKTYETYDSFEQKMASKDLTPIQIYDMWSLMRQEKIDSEYKACLNRI